MEFQGKLFKRGQILLNILSLLFSLSWNTGKIPGVVAAIV
jgi:hypothetical protein